MMYPTQWPQFFTATINQWKHCLNDDGCKDIIVNCLQTMVANKEINLYAYVIMSNHIHLIWQPLGDLTPSQIHSSFTNFTGKQIKNRLSIHNPILLEELKSNYLNRQFQIWKRRSLSVELFSQKAFMQKLIYIHNNPVKARLTRNASNYPYSSAAFYENGIDHFNMLTHYAGS